MSDLMNEYNELVSSIGKATEEALNELTFEQQVTMSNLVNVVSSKLNKEGSKIDPFVRAFVVGTEAGKKAYKVSKGPGGGILPMDKFLAKFAKKRAILSEKERLEKQIQSMVSDFEAAKGEVE